MVSATTSTRSRPRARHERLFVLVMLACIQFVVLTAVAMVLYTGGMVGDPASRGYHFFQNFFSDLGMTVSRAGAPNTASAILFFVALTVAGLGLALFFIAVPPFFRRERLARVLSYTGSIVGVVSGLSFAGIAFTPANLFLEAHGLFVQAAFLAFFIAVLFYIPAVLLTRGYPNRYALVYACFAIVLAGYLWLLFYGPSPRSPDGLLIQATGQKVIVYAAIITALIEADGARRLARREEEA